MAKEPGKRAVSRAGIPNAPSRLSACAPDPDRLQIQPPVGLGPASQPCPAKAPAQAELCPPPACLCLLGLTPQGSCNTFLVPVGLAPQTRVPNAWLALLAHAAHAKPVSAAGPGLSLSLCLGRSSPTCSFSFRASSLRGPPHFSCFPSCRGLSVDAARVPPLS